MGLLEEFEKENPDCNILYMMFRNAEIFDFWFFSKNDILWRKMENIWTIEEYFSFEIESSKLINYKQRYMLKLPIYNINNIYTKMET